MCHCSSPLPSPLLLQSHKSIFSGDALKHILIISIIRPQPAWRRVDRRALLKLRWVPLWVFSMDFSKFLYGFVIFARWIPLSCYMDLSKLIHGFFWSALWICQSSFMDFSTLLHGLVKDFLCFSCLLPNKNKLKFDQFVYMILSILRERYQFLV